MFATTRALTFLLLVSGMVSAQIVETLVANAATDPDNSRLIIIQPSQNPSPGTLTLAIDGPVGTLPVPILSLDADFSASNDSFTPGTGPLDNFCGLCPGAWFFPSPFDGQLANWLAVIPPLSGTPLSVLPNVPLSALVGLPDISFYVQAATLDVAGNQLNFSGGLTITRAEPSDAVASGAQPITPVSPVADAHRGQAMATGDFNGDGVMDLAVGHPGEAASGLAGAGRVFIYLAQAGGGLQSAAVILEEPTVVFSGIMQPLNDGPQTGAAFGAALVAGDFDNDGVDELAVASPEGDQNGPSDREGQVFLFHELEAMLGPGAPGSVIGPDAWGEGQVVRLRPAESGPEALPLISLARFGFSLTAGDLDEDGIPDIAVGAPFIVSDTSTELEQGAVYVFLSRNNAFGPGVPGARQEDVLIRNVVGQVTPPDFARFGATLGIGDLGGSAAPELVVGIPGEDVAGIVGAGRLVAYSDFELASPIANPSAILISPNPIAGAGLGLSLAVGDFNGDGLEDVAAGSNATVGGAIAAGVVHVWSVQPGFLTNVVEIIAPPVPTSGPPNPQPLQRFGFALSSADLDRDGLADLSVGAPGVNVGGVVGAGQVTVYFGNGSGTLDEALRRLVLVPQNPTPLGSFGSAFAAADFRTDTDLPGVRPVASLVVGAPLATRGGGFGAGAIALYEDLLARNGPFAVPCP